MKNTYELYQEKMIKYPDCELIICGYNDDHLIGATRLKPLASFRKLSKDTYISDNYKDASFRYVYIDEVTMIKQYPEIE